MKIRLSLCLFAVISALILSDQYHGVSGNLDLGVPAKVEAGKAVLEAALEFLKNKNVLKDMVENFSTFLGPAGAVLSLILVFLPKQESAELKYMKSSFTQMFHQLNSIEQKVVDLQTVVEWENQRSNYMEDFQQIDYAYQKTQDMMLQLDAVECESKDQCENQKIAIAASFVSHFDVDQNVFNLLVYTIKKDTFNSHIPSLVATNTKCDINKLRALQQSVLASAFKGQVVANLHAKLTNSQENAFTRNERWTMRARAFQDAMEVEILNCYKTIATYIKSEVEDKKYQKSDYSANTAAVEIEHELRQKYTWIDWLVIGARGDDDNKFHSDAGKWDDNLPGAFENTPDNEADQASKKYIVALPIERNEQCQGVSNATLMENYNWIRDLFMELGHIHYSRCQRRCGYLFSLSSRRCQCSETLNDFHSTVWTLFKTVVEERGKRVNFPFLGLIFRADGDYGYVKQGDHSLMHTLHDSQLQPHLLIQPYLMLAFSQPNCPRPAACTNDYCNNNGVCTRLPYSTINYCSCIKGYSGARCEKKTQIKQIEDLLDMAVTVPQIHDVAFAVEDLQQTTSAEFLETRSLIVTVEKRLIAAMETVSKELRHENQWGQLLTKYYNAVKSINHALDIYSDTNQTSTYVSKDEWAKYVTRVDGMGLWLKQYHKMMTGKDTEIFGDDPLMLQLLKMRWDNQCTEDYKKSMTTAWALMLGTQMKGYLALEDAFQTLNMTLPNYDGAKLMKQRIQAQSEVFQEQTCSVDMPNTVNLQNCVDPKVPFGFLPESTMAIQCKANHFSVQTQFVCNKDKPIIASMSSIKIYDGLAMYPYYAIDGSFATFAETEVENHPWLQVDFGVLTALKRVTLFAHDDVNNSLQSGTVTVGNTPAKKGQQSSNPACGKWNNQPSRKGYVVSVTCFTPLMGRYAILQSDAQSLRIAEVEINNVLDFQSGSAVAKATTYMGSYHLQACYDQCRSQGGNGITRTKDAGKGSSHCWCRFGMTNLDSDTGFVSAFFEPLNPEETVSETKPIPRVIADSDPFSEVYAADENLFVKACESNGNYYLGKQATENTYFIVDLGSYQRVSEISLVNTHNDISNDRGTKDFIIDLSMSQLSWTTAVTGTLQSVFNMNCNDIPTENFPVADITARYIRFTASTYYNQGSGLNYIGWKSVPVSDITPPRVIEDKDSWSEVYAAGPDLFVQACELNGNYYLGKDNMADTYFIVDLLSIQILSEISLVNAHNAVANDRGTKDFVIDLSTDNVAWSTAVTGTLQSVWNLDCDDIPTEKFAVANIKTSFIKFTAKTFYGAGSGLQYIGWTSVLVSDATHPRVINDDNSWSDVFAADQDLFVKACESNGNYYLGKDATPDTSFIVDLMAMHVVYEISLVNSHNVAANDRGTKDFVIDLSPNNVDWSTAVTGTLQSALNMNCNDIPLEKFAVNNVKAGFIRFTAKTYYGIGSGLKYIGWKSVPVSDITPPQIIEDKEPFSDSWAADQDLFVKSCDSLTPQPNYYLGKDGTVDTYFIVDLGSYQSVSEISLVNAHNAVANDRGTKDFVIEFSNDQVSWATAVTGTLQSVWNMNCNDIPIVRFAVADMTTRFIKFTAKTFYGAGSGLQYIGWNSLPVAVDTTSVAVNYFNEFLSLSGCQACHCDVAGSTSTQCAVTSGVCPCKSTHCGPKCINKTCDSTGAVATCIRPTESCQCKAGFCGDRCEKKTCTAQAVSTCIAKDQTCACHVGYWGDTCQFRRCDAQGSNYESQTPANGQCPCNPGWSGTTCNCRNCHGANSYDTCADQFGNCNCKPLYKGNLCQDMKSVLNSIWVQNSWACYAWNYWIRACGPLGCCNTNVVAFIEREDRPTWTADMLGECKDKDLGSNDITIYIQTDRDNQYICVTEYGWNFQGVSGYWSTSGIDQRRGTAENNHPLGATFHA